MGERIDVGAVDGGERGVIAWIGAHHGGGAKVRGCCSRLGELR